MKLGREIVIFSLWLLTHSARALFYTGPEATNLARGFAKLDAPG